MYLSNMAAQSLSWAVSPLAFYSTLISCMVICMVQAGPMQEGFHISAGLAHDLDHNTGVEGSAVSYTEFHPSGNYFQVNKTRLPTPAGFLHYPITVPYFWDPRDAQVWGSALQKNLESGLPPANWIPPVHPQYDSTRYPGSAAQPQHGPYPVAQNMQPFFDPASQRVGPINQQLRATRNQRKPPAVDPNPQTNHGSTGHPAEKDFKGKAASSDSTADGASGFMGTKQPSTAGQADRMKKMIRPKDDGLSELEAWHSSDTRQSRKPSKTLNPDSAVFRQSSASLPMKNEIQVIPSSAKHSIAPVFPKKSGNLKQIKTFKEISNKSPAPESREKMIVPSSDGSDKQNWPHEDASSSSSSVYSNAFKDQEWQVVPKKNRKSGKPLQPTHGNPPTSSGPEKILLDKSQLTKAQDFKYTRKGEPEDTEVPDEPLEDQNAPGSRPDLDTEGQNFAKIGEANKKKKKKKKKGAKPSKDDQVDDEVLKTVAYIAPDAKSKIQEILWDLVQGDNPKPLLTVELNGPRYNEIFSLDSRHHHLRGHVIDQLMDQHVKELISKVSFQEANRRVFALENQLIEENRLKNWKMHKQIVSEHVKDIVGMLKGDEMWPVFYQAKPDDWKVVEGKISELDLRSKNSLDLAIPEDIRSKRIATMYAAGEANRHQNQMMYTEEELKAWTRQGVSAALLIRVGDILELTSPKANWENMSQAQLGLKARDFFNCLKGKIVVGKREIYREPVPWYASGARMLILEDKKFRDTFDDRLKRLVEYGQDRFTIYDKTLVPQDQTLINQVNKNNDAKEVDKEKEKLITLENDEIITLSSHMIGIHFGISAKQLIEFNRKIRLQNAMFDAQTKRVGSRINHPKPGVTWPKSVSKELAPLKSQFRQFHNFFGTAFNE